MAYLKKCVIELIITITKNEILIGINKVLFGEIKNTIILMFLPCYPGLSIKNSNYIFKIFKEKI